MEGSFFLKFMPLLMEYVHRFRHLELGQEVANEVIDYYILADRRRLWLLDEHPGLGCLFPRHLLLKLISFFLERGEVIQVIVILLNVGGTHRLHEELGIALVIDIVEVLDLLVLESIVVILRDFHLLEDVCLLFEICHILNSIF